MLLFGLSSVLCWVFLGLSEHNYHHSPYRFYITPMPVLLGGAVLGASLGLIASVVRYRHPLRSTFAVAIAALFMGIVLFHSLPVSPAFADAQGIVNAVMLAVFLLFAYIFLLPIGFASCAVGGCVAGHVIQERSKRWFATPTLPARIVLTLAMTGSAAALACTLLWPGL